MNEKDIAKSAPSGNVISLAERRERATAKEYLPVFSPTRRRFFFNGRLVEDRKVSHVRGTFFDAWMQTDGTVLLRASSDRVTYERTALTGCSAGIKIFECRGNAYELRIRPEELKMFVDAFRDLAMDHRELSERSRGEHLWQCSPNDDGTFKVKHGGSESVYHLFKPRRQWTCERCRRAINKGDTGYREKSSTWKHRGGWSKAHLCAACITQKAAL